MSLLESIRDTFGEASHELGGAAAATREVERRVRAQGRACTRDVLLHELAHPEAPLRSLERAKGALAAVAECSASQETAGAGDTLVLRGARGLRPTPHDALRVLARGLDGRGGAARARWSRLLHASRRTPTGRSF